MSITQWKKIDTLKKVNFFSYTTKHGYKVGLLEEPKMMLGIIKFKLQGC